MKTALIFMVWAVLVVIPADYAVTCNGNYFHVDDFVGLGGGINGQLVPINGFHSLWGGVRASQSGYPSDGYGNGWNECWESCSLSVDPDSSISVSYSICYDTEPSYDNAYFEYYDGVNWTTLKTYNGQACIQEQVTIPGAMSAVELRFRVESDAAWSDQDGMWDTDGAIVVDDISVFSGTQLVNFEDFECEAVGDQRTLDGRWVAGTSGACLDTIPCEPDTTASIQGIKYVDVNGNGIKDTGELGLPGVTIDLLQNGSVIQSTTTLSQGDYAFTNLQSGTYTVAEIVVPGMNQTSPQSVYYTISLLPGEHLQGFDFGNFFCTKDTCLDSCVAGNIDEFNTSDGPESTQVNPAYRTFLENCGSGREDLFDEFPANQCFGYTFTSQDTCMAGCWGYGVVVGATVEIRMKASSSGAPGTDALAFRDDTGAHVWWISMNDLQSWQTSGGDISWSNNDVNTFILDLANLPQAYNGVTNIIASLQDGDLSIYVQDDTAVDYIKLWVEVCDAGRIQGSKYEDINGNGIRDMGEPGLEGWTIQLVRSDVDVIIGTATTNAQGDYEFKGLQPIAYNIAEIPQSGWSQTDPPSVFHTVTLQPGELVQGLDFGNYSCEQTSCWDSCLAGNIDEFITSDGPESTYVNPAYKTFLENCGSGREDLFDEFPVNECFGYTFTDQDSCMTGCWGSGVVVGARVEIRLKAPSSGAPGTDALAFRDDTGAHVWWIDMDDLQSWQTGGADISWSHNDVNTFILDLANLPQAYKGVTNILASMQDGDLSIYLQDDTAVDYIKFWVEVCESIPSTFNNSSCDSSCTFSSGTTVNVSFENLVTGASVEGLGAAHPDLNITSLPNPNPNYPSSCAPTGAFVIEEGVGTASYGSGPVSNDCLSGVKGFGDAQLCVLDYQFTFAPGKSVDCFSIRMLDYGDYFLYSPTDTHEVLLTAYDAGITQIDQDVLFFTGGELSLSGDACTAAEGEPGNLILSVMGAGIKRVDLTFTKSPDPNVGFDDIAFCTQIDSQECVTAPEGLKGWWGGDGNENDISGYGNHGSFSGPSGYSISPKVRTGAFLFNGTNYVNVPDNPSLDFGTAFANNRGDFSIDAWVKLPDPNGTFVILSKLPPGINPAPWGYSFKVNNGKLAITLVTALTGVTLTDNSTLVVPAGLWTHVAVTVDRKPSNPTVTFFINGQAGGSLPAQQEIAANISNNVDLQIGPLAAGGELDEVELIGRVLSANEINGIFMADYAGKCLPGDPPIIDCNFNTIDDKIDIANGTSVDTNGDDVPDECQTFWVPSDDGAVFCNNCINTFYDTIPIINLGGIDLPLTIEDSCSVFNIIFGAGSFNIAPGDSHMVAIRFNPVDTGSTMCVIPTGYYPGIICTGNTSVLSGIGMINHSASWENEHVVVRWTMGSGIRVSDFEISRKESGDFTLLSQGPIKQTADGFIFLDMTAQPGKKYVYRITAKKGDAELASFEITVSTPAPKFALFQNYPNPFNAKTTISFSLDHPERTRLRIYDVTGRFVRTIVNRRLKVGIHRETWDGRDESGRMVAAGIYFYRLQTGTRSITKKAVILR